MTLTTKERLVQEQLDKLVKREFYIFLFEKWLISSGEHAGEKFSIKDTPCLEEVVKDTFPFQVMLKSAQSRISEIHIAKAIHHCISKKGNILYSFPAGEQMQQFVDARPRPAIENNPWLFDFVTGSLNLKKFSLNDNSLYFRGAQKRRQMISIDVSVVFADEIAEYEEGVINLIQKRLGAAKEPERYYFSTPKFSGADISLFYYGDETQKERGSDQRVWCIKCAHCNKYNEDLIWEENVVDLNHGNVKFSHYQPDTIVVCRHCKKPLNRLSAGEWIAKHPKNSDYCHGRHVSKLFFPTSNLNEMMLDSKNSVKEQEFWNSDMGLPYEVKGARLTDAVINSCRGPYTLQHKNTTTECFVGTDIGNKIHTVISTLDENNRIKILLAKDVNSWAELHTVHRDFNVTCHVIDMNPDKDEAIEFQGIHDNVYLSYFKQSLENGSTLFEEEEENIIPTHRTLIMSRVLDMFHDKDFVLPMDIATVRDFHSHLTSIVKALKQDDKNNWVSWYPKMGKPDHYFFAILYNLIATQLKPKPSIFRLIRTALQ